MEDEARRWMDDEVEFGERPAPNANWNGRLKVDGTPVRKCDGGHWKLLEEFPTKQEHFATWDCYYCLEIPKPMKKPKKKLGERGNRYNEYVQECQRIKSEMDRITSEYLTAKTKVQDEKRQLEKEYRQWLQNH